jgi:antitoxin MazE
MAVKTPIRQIGNSKGVILPSAVLKAVGAESELEMRVDGNQIILEPVKALRQGWFDNASELKTSPEETEWDRASLVDDSEWRWE